MSKSQTCRSCTETKELSEFWKLAPPIAKRCGRSHSLDCRQCMKIAKDARRATRGENGSTDAEKPEAAIPAEHKMTSALCLQVDVVWDGTDFVFTQTNPNTGPQTIYVAPHALQSIWDFAERLAHQQPATEAAPAVAA